MTIEQFGRGIRQYFHADPDKFLFKDVLIAFGDVMLDIIYFDDWLKEQEGYDDCKSIRENVEAMYGEGAAKFVERVL